MSTKNHEDNLELTVSRLYSQDANDRVKAAGELGEIGTPEIAPKLLEVTYEDEASTVRQMAIQSYAEILEEQALDEVIKVAEKHFDDYVRMYAIMVLGRIGGEKVGKPLSEYIFDDNKRLQASALRAMIHADTSDFAENVFKLLQQSNNNLVERNCIEALALWGYEDAKHYIIETYFENNDSPNLELKTISAFYLAATGDERGENYLANEPVDNFIRIAIDDVHYKGKKGLLEAASLLR